MAEATLIQVKSYFEIESAAEFSKEWKQLTDKDKEQLKQGIGDGSLTY